MTVQTEQLLRPTDSLANRLWLLRLELGRREGRRGPVSQKETALRCGVGYGAWQSWEEGRAPRDAIRQLSKVADALSIDRDWLMFGGPLRPEDAEPAPPTPITGPRADIPAGLSAQHPNGGYETVENDITRLRKRIPLTQTSSITSMWRVAA